MNMTTMKAVTYDRFGDDSVLAVSEQPVPPVGPGEVLVRVKAAGVNPVDWKVMSGGLASLMVAQFPVVPGWDVAGVVESVGIDSVDYAVGDEVIAYARKDWVHGGTFAEFVTVPPRCLARKPERLSWAEAARRSSRRRVSSLPGASRRSSTRTPMPVAVLAMSW